MLKVKRSIKINVVILLKILFKNIISVREVGITIALLVIILYFGLSTEKFFSAFNMIELSRQASYVGIMVIGMVFVISSGNIDLSVGAIYMLSPVVTALAMEAGSNQYLAILLGIITGIVCGIVNGGLSILLRIPMIVITLGTITIYKGIGLLITNARPVFDFNKDTQLFNIGGEFIGPLPTSTVVFLVFVIIFTIIYTLTPFGRRVKAIGANMEVANALGININKTKLTIVMLQGFLCAVSGILAMLFLRVAEPTQGGGYELCVIAAAIIGGASISGGSGSIVGGFYGALIIAVIRNGLVISGVHYYWSGIATGLIVIAAVYLDYLLRSRRQVQ